MKLNWETYADDADKFLGRARCETIDLSEMAVAMTAHATDRAVTRDGKPVGITRDTIQHIVDAAESKIMQLGKKYSTLILKTGDAINVVGSLSQQAGEWVFNVITIMIKKNFVPKNAWDKVVYVNENLKEESDLRSTIKKLKDQGYTLERSYDAFKLKKDDQHFLEFAFVGGGYTLQKLFAAHPYDPYDALVEFAQTGKIQIRYNSLSTDFPIPDASPRLKNSYAKKSIAPQVKEGLDYPRGVNKFKQLPKTGPQECPKCKGLIEYDSNFKVYNCTKCDWSEGLTQAENKLNESMQRECHIFKAKGGKWYMYLAPEEYGDLDTAYAYGPFDSEEATFKYLDNNFSNPGGMSIDKSGKATVPKKSPNGSPVEVPKKSQWYEESTQSSLVSIINRIEKERIGKISKLDEFKVGIKVKHQSRHGRVVAISPKKTSVLVEFSDKTQQRFFVNKRAKNNTLDELSLHKLLSNT